MNNALQEFKTLGNPYEYLGIERTATNAEIQTAYRRKALVLHPDRNPDDPEAQQKFHLLKTLSEFLKDENNRTLLNNHLDYLAEQEKVREAANESFNYFKNKLAQQEAQPRPKSSLDKAKLDQIASQTISFLQKEQAHFAQEFLQTTTKTNPIITKTEAKTFMTLEEYEAFIFSDSTSSPLIV